MAGVVSAIGVVALFLGALTMLLAAVAHVGGGSWRHDSPGHLLRRSPQLVVFWAALRWWRVGAAGIVIGVGCQGVAAVLSAAL